MSQSTSPQASEQGWVEAHDPLPNPVEGVVGEGNSSKPEAVQCSEWEGLQMAWSRLSEDILSGRSVSIACQSHMSTVIDGALGPARGSKSAAIVIMCQI